MTCEKVLVPEKALYLGDKLIFFHNLNNLTSLYMCSCGLTVDKVTIEISEYYHPRISVKSSSREHIPRARF